MSRCNKFTALTNFRTEREGLEQEWTELTIPNNLLCQMYRPIKETPCHFITTLDELVELNEKLMNCKEFALDLEVIGLCFLFKNYMYALRT